MCGIVGIWDKSGGEGIKNLLDRGVYTLSHRGPDDTGTWLDYENGLAFGHKRLAIIDLSEGGHQPMMGPAGRTCVIFNGEIYDYVETRRRLESQGVSFRTSSDTEVILALYECYGIDFLQYLRGMFAFALWDAATRRLILARDRLGKKPLYYCCEGDSLYFGSEIKAVVAGLPGPPSIDFDALDEYLSFGFISGERTIYRQIKEVPPGWVLVATSPNEFRMIRYWEPRWKPKQNIKVHEAVAQLESLLSESVKIRLRSDVPVGIFLSGGIDSGLITALASNVAGERLLTFSVGFEDGSFDERILAREVARQYDTDHHEVILRPDVASLIPKIVWHYDEPFADASAIPSFAISEYARQHIKVVLNGDGGDELFGGYRRHIAAMMAARIQHGVAGKMVPWAADTLVRNLPYLTTFRTPYAFAHRFLRGLASNNVEKVIAWYTNGFTPREKGELYQHPSGADQAFSTVESMLTSLGSLGNLDRAIAMDLMWELPGDLLVKMDIATMAHGLEARSPFLDEDLVDWANTLPEAVRLPGLTTKPLLRELARRYLPDSVVEAPKRGFEVPLNRWLNRELREMCHDLILSRDGIMCSLFHRSRLELLLRRPYIEPDRWAQCVWILFMLAAWDRHRYRC